MLTLDPPLKFFSGSAPACRHDLIGPCDLASKHVSSNLQSTTWPHMQTVTEHAQFQISQLYIHVQLRGVSSWTKTSNYSLMRGRIKGPCPLVNPMQSDNIFITRVIIILHGNSTPKATNL